MNIIRNLSAGLTLVKNPEWEDRVEGAFFSAEISHGLSNIIRNVRIPRNDPVIEVEDSITGREPWIILWNLGHDVSRLERVEVAPEPGVAGGRFGWFLVTAEGKSYSLTVSVRGQREEAECSVRVYEGCEDPFLGWYSPAYLVKVPVKTIAVRINPAHRNPINVFTRLAAVE
jgi:hypothetical protein